MLRALTGRKETRADRRRSENLWTDELGILGWCTSKYKRTVWGLAASFSPQCFNSQKAIHALISRSRMLHFIYNAEEDNCTRLLNTHSGITKTITKSIGPAPGARNKFTLGLFSGANKKKKLKGKKTDLIQKTYCQLAISPTSNIIQFPL